MGLKRTIIENFIDWYVSNEEERLKMKESAEMYVMEDHVNEILDSSTTVLTEHLKEVKHKAFIMWGTQDVIDRARQNNLEVTEEQAEIIIADINRQADCSLGITWDTIDAHLDNLK